MKPKDTWEIHLDRRLTEENIFGSPKEQLEAGECNLSQEVKA